MATDSLTATDRQHRPKMPKRRAALRSPYGKFSVFLLLVSAATLIPSYFHTLIAEPGRLPGQVVVHGALFLAWYALVCIQAALVGTRKIATHRRMGYISIAFALLLCWSGAQMLLGTMNSYQPDWSAQYLASRTSFVWAIGHTLVSFASFYLLAVLYRRNAQAHKRLITLASLSMMSASITRVAYLPFIPIDGTLFTLLATYGFLAVPLIIDRIHHQRIHPVLVYGTGTYIVTQLLCIGLLPSTAMGQALAFVR